jgi:hypothetical protein
VVSYMRRSLPYLCREKSYHWIKIKHMCLSRFVDSPYYSESELCGGVVTFFFRSTSLFKRCTSYNAPPTSRKRAIDRWSLRNFLPRSSLFMVGKAQKSHGARSVLYGECSNGVPPIHFFQTEHRIQFRSRSMRFLGLGSSEAKNFELINGLQHVFEKWVERCKKYVAYQGRYFEKKKTPSPHLHKVPTRSNKVSPRTLQTPLVFSDYLGQKCICTILNPILHLHLVVLASLEFRFTRVQIVHKLLNRRSAVSIYTYLEILERCVLQPHTHFHVLESYCFFQLAHFPGFRFLVTTKTSC